jgi:hypothetical protein
MTRRLESIVHHCILLAPHARRKALLALGSAVLLVGVLVVPTTSGAANPAWVLRTSYAPSYVSGDAVACPATNVCYQLGQTVTGVSTVSASFDGGATWSLLRTRGIDVLFTAIACSAATDCVAVDGESSLVTEWTTNEGATWTLRKLPAGVAEVDSITCVKGNVCVAAGYNDNEDPVLMVTGDEGRVWRIHPIPPAVADGVSMSGASMLVACMTGRECLAAGRFGGAADVYRTLDGGLTWRTIKLPGGLSRIGALSCDRAGLCAVSSVGHLIANSVDGGLVWALRPGPASDVEISDVDCPADGFCVGVGDSAQGHVVVLRTNVSVSRWTVASIAGPAGAQPNAISCAAHGSCAVVGESPDSTEFLASSSDTGRTWHNEDASVQALEPISVSCAVPGTCEAVGIELGQGIAMGTTNDGATWTNQQLPTGVQALYRVSCASASVCQASGVRSSPPGPVMLGTTDGGAAWSVEPIPSSVDELESMDCPSLLVCAAVGVKASGQPAVIATSDGGATWTAGTVSGVKEQIGIVLTVSCATPSNCIAGMLGFPQSGYLATSDGGASWTFAAAPNTGLLSLFAEPVSVGCATASDCVAIVDELALFSLTPGLSVQTSTNGGSTWTPDDVLGASVSSTSPMSCQSSGSCEMVGNDSSEGATYLLSSNDAGTRWSSSPMPAGLAASNGLSCPSPTTCMTIGELSAGGFVIESLG